MSSNDIKRHQRPSSARRQAGGIDGPGYCRTRTSRGLLVLLALVLVLGGATTVLSLRARHLASALPTHRVEPLVELGAVSIGALAALWVALSALVALACVAARAAGRSWSTGERLLRRAAPGVVRHAARTAVGVTVGASLLLAGGTAHATTTPADDPGVVAVDLGWRPSGAGAGDEGVGPGNAASEGTASTASTTPGTSPATADGSTAASGGPAGAPADAAPGRPAVVTSTPPSLVPAPSAPTGATPPVGAESTGARDAVDHGGTHAAGPGDVGQGRRPLAPLDRRSPPRGVAGRRTPARRGPGRDARRPGPQAAPEVVVVRGDSLWSIAARHLPAGSTDRQVAEAVERWYATNAHVVGADPDLVRPGQVLVAPPA